MTKYYLFDNNYNVFVGFTIGVCCNTLQSKGLVYTYSEELREGKVFDSIESIKTYHKENKMPLFDSKIMKVKNEDNITWDIIY